MSIWLIVGACVLIEWSGFWHALPRVAPDLARLAVDMYIPVESPIVPEASSFALPSSVGTRFVCNQRGGGVGGLKALLISNSTCTSAFSPGPTSRCVCHLRGVRRSIHLKCSVVIDS